MLSLVSFAIIALHLSFVEIHLSIYFGRHKLIVLKSDGNLMMVFRFKVNMYFQNFVTLLVLPADSPSPEHGGKHLDV